MWMGGWRPTTAIVMAYSLMGIQIESGLQRLLEGISLHSMASLSAKQLARLNVIQQHTSTTEDEISNRLAVLQVWFLMSFTRLNGNWELYIQARIYKKCSNSGLFNQHLTIKDGLSHTTVPLWNPSKSQAAVLHLRSVSRLSRQMCGSSRTLYSPRFSNW